MIDKPEIEQAIEEHLSTCKSCAVNIKFENVIRAECATKIFYDSLSQVQREIYELREELQSLRYDVECKVERIDSDISYINGKV